MRFPCTINQLPDGRWQMRHSGADVGEVEAIAGSREDVLEKMRGELRYRLELCPCSGESYQHVEVEIAEG